MSARLSDLRLLAPDFRAKVETLQARLDLDGIPLRVFETARSPERQAALYARGRTPHAPDFGRTVTRAKAYQSMHQWGLAADFVFLVDGKWTWEEPTKGAWDRFAALADALGLVRLSFEKPHVQAPVKIPSEKPGPMDTAGWMSWLTERAR